METQVLIHIPEISKEMVWELYSVIKPVVSFDWKNGKLVQVKEGHLFYLTPVNPFTINFLWNPVAEEEATGLKMLRDITTYHRYTFGNCFDPTVAEVLAQIPDELIGEVVAFEIIKHSRKPVRNHHVATTRLYAKNIRSK